jgi:hypothetical protein
VEGNEPATWTSRRLSFQLPNGDTWSGYDSTALELKAYVDGELVEEMNYDAALPADFTAGTGAGSDVNSFYRGLIDEFAVYTNLLSGERILAHYATVKVLSSVRNRRMQPFSGNTVTFTAD